MLHVPLKPFSQIFSGPSCCLVAAALFCASCDRRAEEAVRWLEKRGVEASGASLLAAVTARDAATASRLLEAGVFTEQRDPAGRTPLAIAVHSGAHEFLPMLLNAGADANAAIGTGGSILGTAIAAGNRPIARTLIASGARTDGRMPDGESILPWAIRNGDRGWIDMALHSEIDPRIRDRDGTPLLHLAARAGDEALVNALLDLGADPAVPDREGRSVLEDVLRHPRLSHDARVSLARRLVAAGADPNARGSGGRSLLEAAIARRDLREIAGLLRLGADPNHSAAGSGAGPFAAVFNAGDTELFACFLEAGARPPGGSSLGWFERCLRERRLAETALLLRHDRECVRPRGLSFHPVERAVLRRDARLAKLLLDYGFEPGRALHIAAHRGDNATAGMLLAAGAPPDTTRFPCMETPLSAAIRDGHDRLALLLLRHGADSSLPPPEGQTLFHFAVARSCPETVRHLLDHGADPNEPFEPPVSAAFARHFPPGVMRWVLLKDLAARPIMVAAHNGDIPTARYLIKAGAKLNVRTKIANLWPINFASRRSDVAMMRLLLGRDPRREDRRIEIRLSEQRARLYDGEGSPVFETSVSTGKQGFATPTGTYVITNKYRQWTSTLYDASMPFFQRLSCGDFGLHQGNVPGYPASHGCIRVPAGNAARLFSLTETGDRVTILP